MKAAIKRLVFRMLRKDPEAIVVSFASGDPALAGRMFAEMQELVPGRRHVLVKPEDLPAATWRAYLALRRQFARYRIGLAPVLFTKERKYAALRRAAFLLAPTKILAYNPRLERFHLRAGAWISSLLFVRGVALDRIHLRPKWLVPWKQDRSSVPEGRAEFEGRALGGRPRLAVLTPYFPYPLAHGGAVRIFNLLRAMAEAYDVFLLSFRDGETEEEVRPLLDFCARVTLVEKPRYREPRWSTLWPPEAHEFQSPAMHSALRSVRERYNVSAVQVEYTFLAPYRGDLLVEHDVTFALQRQVHEQRRDLSSWWDWWRWKRFETRWVKRYARVVAMSDEDRALLGGANVWVIPNGVDLERFTPELERPGERLLFIGSFRHFPNIAAFRFFWEQVWPEVQGKAAGARLTVVAGPEPRLYWREYTGLPELPSGDGLTLLGYVADVRPLYVEANLVIVPTPVSAGTNLKVLEAMAMQRAVISTSRGCQGLGLQHGKDVWVADTAGSFIDGVYTLLENRILRQQIASEGRVHVERRFGWKQIGAQQRALLRDLIGGRQTKIRKAAAGDLSAIAAIQSDAPEASQWKARDYLTFDCHVAEVEGRLAGFIVSRQVAQGEREILNVAVDPEWRRRNVATELIRAELTRWPGAHFLEVRESNAAARGLYERLGFTAVGARPEYYDDPPETGIVMRIFS